MAAADVKNENKCETLPGGSEETFSLLGGSDETLGGSEETFSLLEGPDEALGGSEETFSLLGGPDEALGGSEETFSLICLPCYRDGTHMPASGYCNVCLEHLCLNCKTYHKKATPSRHHTLLDKDTMPSTQQLTDTPVHVDTIDNLTTPCQHHPKEMIKFFCNHHNLLLCSICVAQEHTNNCHVEYIPDGVSLDRGFFIQTMTRVDQLLKKCTRLKIGTCSDVSKSNDSLKNALLDIKKYKQEINDKIDRLEKEIEKKIEAIQNENTERLQTVDTTCDDVMKKLQAMNDTVKQIDPSVQAEKLFVEVLQLNDQLNGYEETIFSLSTEDRIGEFKFNPSQAITDVFERETMIGDVSMVPHEWTSTATQSAYVAFSAHGNIAPTLLGEICVKTSEDRANCFVAGMTALPANRLVLTDSRNNSIKLVDVNKQSITAQLSLGREEADSPFDITSTTSKQVAVTVPGRKRILLLTVSNKLKAKIGIETEYQCHGVCCYQKRLIVTYQYSNKLDILNMKGKVIQRVQLPSAGEDIRHSPDNVQANSRYIYVSDHHHVLVLNWEGGIVSTCEDMDYPICISLLHDGSVVACDGVTSNVCQISADGTYRGTVLHDVRSQSCICVNTDRHELYISRYSQGKDKIDNSILVYKI